METTPTHRDERKGPWRTEGFTDRKKDTVITKMYTVYTQNLFSKYAE